MWSRQLVLVFGNTTQAVSAILAGFFGGIAVGSFVGGRIADRVRVPVRMYAVLELVLAVVVLVTPLSFRLINTLYRDIYPSLEASPGLLALARVALAVLALAPATILMGATLPTLTRQFAGDVSLAGAFSRLYAANTIGAIVGTVVAGFVLIELLGLSGALAVGASCSAVAGLAALWLGRGVQGRCLPRADRDARSHRVVRAADRPTGDVDRGGTGRGRHGAATSTAARADARRRSIPALALGVAFVSGLTSLGYQVTWTRLLASGTGNTTYVFTTILAMFLLGLAIGAVLFAALRTRLGDPIRLLAVSQIIAAVLATLGLVFVLVAAEPPTPNKWQESLETLFRLVVHRRPAGHDRPRRRLPGVVGAAPRRGRTRRARLRLTPRDQHDRLDRGQPPRAVLPDPARRVAGARRRACGGQRERRPPPRLEDVEAFGVRRGACGRPRGTETERPLDRRRRCPGPDRDRRDGHPPRSPRPTRARRTSNRSAGSSSNRRRTRSRRSRPARSCPLPSCGSPGPR